MDGNTSWRRRRNGRNGVAKRVRFYSGLAMSA
jgi:hypothetical protein